MHAHSIIAFPMLDIAEREAQVLASLHALGGRATDRQVATHMGSSDPNRSRPRITELIKRGVLRECGSVIDQTTNRCVRLIEIIDDGGDRYEPAA